MAVKAPSKYEERFAAGYAWFGCVVVEEDSIEWCRIATQVPTRKPRIHHKLPIYHHARVVQL